MLKFKFGTIETDLTICIIMKQCSLYPRFFDSSTVTVIFMYHFQMKKSVKKLDILNWVESEKELDCLFIYGTMF